MSNSALPRERDAFAVSITSGGSETTPSNILSRAGKIVEGALRKLLRCSRKAIEEASGMDFLELDQRETSSLALHEDIRYLLEADLLMSAAEVYDQYNTASKDMGGYRNAALLQLFLRLHVAATRAGTFAPPIPRTRHLMQAFISASRCN